MENIKNLNIMNSYAEELHEISEKCPPEGFKQAEMILKNYSLAEELGFDRDYVDSSDCLDVFAGNKLCKTQYQLPKATLVINLVNLILNLVMEEQFY